MHVTHIERAYVSKSSICEWIMLHRNLGGTAEILNLLRPCFIWDVFFAHFLPCPPTLLE